MTFNKTIGSDEAGEFRNLNHVISSFIYLSPIFITKDLFNIFLDIHDKKVDRDIQVTNFQHKFCKVYCFENFSTILQSDVRKL